MSNNVRYMLVDVEAAGTSPFSGEMTEFGVVDFKSRISFHGVLAEATPDPANPAVPLILPTTKRFSEPDVFRKFEKWLESFRAERFVFISDNPAYDFMWFGFYADKNLGYNPFGHSGRRISDLAAGFSGNWKNTQKWKKWRVTPHTHNPVDDSMGNAEALQTLLETYNQDLTEFGW